MTGDSYDDDRLFSDVAVIGMAGRFPGAADVGEFWRACVEGAQCTSHWDGPRAAAGQVLAGGLLADQDMFDAAAFGVTPAEAELLDPQHRVFLELCWRALDDAAVPAGGDELVSVYAAAAPSRYRPARSARDDPRATYQQMIANGPDYLATRVSYLLDLRGEAVNVQTACSSSLVAVHLACQSLRTGASDVALAGGVSIDPDQHEGYFHQEGMIGSPDGRCLPFDAEARGAVPGNGAAVVVLQRLGDALDEGRRVHAVIRATAVNNDGRDKSGFMAPTVRGQVEVIASALSTGDVAAESVGYLEAHGTGTRLGDPIEFAAASRAFRMFTAEEAFCALGSLKANFGHLDRAAGVTGLIKVVHAVREGVVPPLTGFRAPNPELRLDGSPFRVPLVADERWPSDGPRRAAVSSFGVGGTNAHAVVEEYRPAPVFEDRAGDGASAVVALPLSAHDDDALGQVAAELADRLDRSGLPLAGVARTLAAGRRAFGTRTVVVAADATQAARLLREPPAPAIAVDEPLAFVFPGQGAEVVYAASPLMARFPVFRSEVEAFADAAGMSADALLDGVSGRTGKYREFAYQPSLVAVQVCLARLAEHLGAEPAVLCGSSIGEYAAAHLAGVFDRKSLMDVLAARDRLMRATAEGRMMAALCSAEQVAGLLVPGVGLAGDNAADRVLLSGAADVIERQREVLAEHGVETRVLPGRIAPHGPMMTEAAEGLLDVLAGCRLRPAQLPVVSTLTGRQAEPDELADPRHWARHLTEPFLVRQALGTLMGSGCRRFVEASPGDTLTRLAARASGSSGQAVTLGGPAGGDPVRVLLDALGGLWCKGTPVRWDLANGTADVPFADLPPYPFQRKRYWSHAPETAVTLSEELPAGRMLAVPVWRPAPLPALQKDALPSRVVVRAPAGGLGSALAARLVELGVTVESVRPGEPVPELTAGPPPVLVDLASAGATPAGDVGTSAGPPPVPVDLTPTATTPGDDVGTSGELESWLEAGLLAPARAVHALRPSRLITVTRGLCPVLPGEHAEHRQAAAVGLVRCAPHEWPGLVTTLVDLSPGDGTSPADEVTALVHELAAPGDRDVAHRGGVRYRRFHEPVRASGRSPLRAGGTYLVIGGTGRLGPVVAEAVSSEVSATIVLAGRTPGRARPAHEQTLVDEARARGCTVVECRLDSADEQALNQLLDDLTDRHGRVDGVFHLAADTSVERFPLLSEVDTAGASAIADAKLRTAAHLAAAVRGRDLGFVVLFSSISTVIGALRFGPYVSANAHLDALASRMRVAEGLPWTSVVWDSWTPTGEATPGTLGALDGGRLLRAALSSDVPVVLALAEDIERRRDQVLADLAVVADASRAASAPEDRSQAVSFVLDTIEQVTGHRIGDRSRSLTGLGIDSLQMMQIAARLRSLFGPSVSLGSVLAAKSVSDIVDLAEQDEPPSPAPAAEVTSEPGADALSTVQQRLWYLAQLEPDAANYNVPFGWCLPDDVDVAAAAAAVRVVLERHELLRSAYQSTADGLPCRVVLDVDDVPVEQVPLTGHDHDQEFAALARRHVDHAFDLRKGTVRVLLAHVAGTAVRVLFVCHHICVDAWSVRIVHDDLRKALSAGATGLAAPPANYHGFVRWEHEVRASPDYPRHLDYWRSVVHGTQPTVPPADSDVPPVTTPGIERPTGVLHRIMPMDALRRLREVLQAQGVTLYTAGLTGLALALSRASGDRDVVIGTNLANRWRPEFEHVVGMFVDPVVLRLRPAEGPGGAPAATLGDALAGVQAGFAEALSHSEVSYLDVAQQAARGNGDNSLFSVIATMFDTGQGDD
ncbi:beta-ketoacyl synthase N-terminal-like domain-containing protein [Lentzea sp. NPDC004789]